MVPGVASPNRPCEKSHRATRKLIAGPQEIKRKQPYDAPDQKFAGRHAVRELLTVAQRQHKTAQQEEDVDGEIAELRYRCARLIDLAEMTGGDKQGRNAAHSIQSDIAMCRFGARRAF